MESSPPFDLSLRSRNGRGKMLWTVSKNTGKRRMALQLLALCLALLPRARADSTSIDDTDPRIDYEPQGAWVPTTDQKSFNNTLTSTFLAGATATLKFNGSAVFYYGSTNMSRSLSNVFLDGDPTILNTFSNDYVGQVKLFEASNLDPMKEHTITIVNTGGNSRILTLDYFVICETFCPELLGSVPKGLTPGAIAGIVLGVLAFVSILFLVLLFLYLRRRRRSFPSSSFSEKSSAFSRPIAALMGYQAARQDEKDMAEKKRQTSRKKKNMVGLADPECLDDETECLTGAGSPPIQEHEPGATPVPSIGMVMANQAPPPNETVARLESLASRNRQRLESESQLRLQGLAPIDEFGLNGGRLYDEVLDGRPSLDSYHSGGSYESGSGSGYANYSNGNMDAVELPLSDAGNPYGILNRDAAYGSSFALTGGDGSSHSSMNVNTSHPNSGSTNDSVTMTPHSAPPVPLSQAQPNHPHAQAQPHRQQSHSQAVRQPPPQPNPQPPFHSRTEPAPQALQSQLKPSMTPQSNPQPQIPPHSQPAPSTIRHLPPTPEAVAPRPATQPIPSPYPDQFTAPSQARPMVVNAVTMPPPQGMAYPVPSQVLQQPTPSATGQVAKNHEYHDLSSPSVGGYPYFPPHMHATHATPPIQVRTRADSNAWAGQGQGSGQPATTPATGGASSATVSYRSAPVSEYQQQSAGAGGPRPSVDSYPYPSHHQVAGRPPLPEL